MRWRLLFICVIVGVTCWISRHFAAEDALIYARYIRNALHGYGLVFNPGERVNALTSPFFAMLLLCTSWLMQGHILAAEIILCGVFLVAACIAVEQLVPWSGVLVASTAYFYFCMGMETFLFLLMLSLLTLLYVKDRIDWIPLLAVLTILTRFEGLALVAIIAFHLLRERRRPAAWSYAPALVVLAAYLYFNHFFYGTWLPASAAAKVEQGLSGLWGRWPTAFLRMGYLLDWFVPSIYIVPLGLIFAVIGIRKEKWSRLNRVLLPFAFALGGFYVFFNIPHYHWYYAPFFFFIAMYAVRGLPQTQVAQVCLVLAICECFGSSLYLLGRASPPSQYLAMGNWIRENTRPDAKVAAVEIGTLAWYDERYMDDLLGLTNPANAKRLMHRDWFSWLPEQRPDYVVIHEQPAFGETAVVASSDYERLPVQFGSVYLMKRKDSTQ